MCREPAIAAKGLAPLKANTSSSLTNTTSRYRDENNIFTQTHHIQIKKGRTRIAKPSATHSACPGGRSQDAMNVGTSTMGTAAMGTATNR